MSWRFVDLRWGGGGGVFDADLERGEREEHDHVHGLVFLDS